MWSEENDLIMLVIMLITSKGWIQHAKRENETRETNNVAQTHKQHLQTI